MKVKLSAIYITLNEIRILPLSVQAIEELVDEIIVVDSGSEDGTVEFCEKHPKIRFYHHEWMGFGPQKNKALEYATGEWVLSLDGDEVPDSVLIHSIRERLLSDDPATDGYLINRSFSFMNKKLKYGGCGSDWLPRLFRREKGEFSDRPIHEKLMVQGKLMKIHQGTLEHFPYVSISEYFNQFNNYTSEAAALKGEKANSAFIKWVAPFRLGFEFIKRYFILGGFLDGYPGLVHSLFAAFYHFVKMIKIYELSYRREENGR